MRLCLPSLRIVLVVACDELGVISFFCAAISEYPVPTLMAVLSWAFIGAPSRLRKAFPRVVDVVSEIVSLPISFRVRELVDDVGFFPIFRQCLSRNVQRF